MEVVVLREAGHEEALRGMAYSYKDRMIDVDQWWSGQRERSEKRLKLLAHKQGGHNKALESIAVWIDIEAPRAWWSEFDTYRVGTSKQSESTMHTLSKRRPEKFDFETGTSDESILAFQKLWDEFKSDVHVLKMNLPEGFLQRRVVFTNYKVLQSIIWQRANHRLKLWKQFEDAILAQVEHPYYLVIPEEE